VDEVIAESADANDLDEKAREFMESLVRGTLRSRAEIDSEIDRLAVGFPTERQTAVDRNILRLAAAEILFQASDAPPGAVVNEAVELAKKYSTGESGRFVNGVLGALVREVEIRRGITPSDAAIGEEATSEEDIPASEGEEEETAPSE